ncbi:hypothetical protein ACH4KN_32870 [Streptomyces sp. NPDC017546]|uniref:hypothetical protein n=1 Tax=Streptomyces sp. NPDC017546 TaxID=3365001 RepID=UPI00379700DD
MNSRLRGATWTVSLALAVAGLALAAPTATAASAAAPAIASDVPVDECFMGGGIVNIANGVCFGGDYHGEQTY